MPVYNFQRIAIDLQTPAKRNLTEFPVTNHVKAWSVRLKEVQNVKIKGVRKVRDINLEYLE